MDKEELFSKRIYVVNAFIVILIVVFSRIFLFPVSTDAANSNFRSMNRYELRDWILDKRTIAPNNVEKAMLEWPETQWGKCTSAVDYIGRVGQEFINLCGSVLQESGKKLGACAEDLSTTTGIFNSGKKCAGSVGEVVGAWGSRSGIVASLTKCTLKSYIVASDMTFQQREDWKTFIDGLDDLTALFSLSDIFTTESIENLGDVAVPKSNKDVQQLLSNIETVRGELTGKTDRIKKVPEQMGSVKKAILTIPAFKNNYFRNQRNEAVEALQECRIDEAMDKYTMTKLQVISQIGSLRAAVVLAEEQFYCTAMTNKFENMSPYDQGMVLGGAGGLYGKQLGRLNKANLEHMRALEVYEELINESELSDQAFNNMKKEFELEEARIKPLTDAAKACVQSCTVRAKEKPTPVVPLSPIMLPPGISQAIGGSIGSNQDKCYYDPQQLIAGLTSYRDTQSLCADSVQEKLDKLARQLDQAQTARRRAEGILDKYEKKIQSLFDTCEVDSKNIQAAKDELQKDMRLDRIAYGFPNTSCYEDKINDLDKKISDRQTECGVNIDNEETADTPLDDDVEFAYIVVRLAGSGFYPHWAGGSHKISGSSQSVYKINKNDDPNAWLEALSVSLRGDVCKMVNPWGFGWVEDTPPSLFNQKKPDVEIITKPYENIKDIDKSLLYSDWKSSGSDGPSLYELRKGCK